jgi:hypothetical protein
LGHRRKEKRQKKHLETHLPQEPILATGLGAIRHFNHPPRLFFNR